MPSALDELLGYGRDFAQGASNAVAGNVSAPVDAISWLLRKAGLDTGTPIGGSDWMAAKGLTAQPKNALAGLLGEAVGMSGPMVAAAKAPQIANALNQVAANAAVRPTLNPQTGAIVYHGSPHKFDAFDASKIGTGEGVQAYGHGLYLAEAPEVAGSYIQAGRNVGFDNWDDPIRLANKAFGNANGNKGAAIGLLDDAIKNTKPGSKQNNLIFAKQALERGDNTAALYKVDLPDDKIARMLDWDKPLSQQAPEVLAAMEKYRMPPNASGQQIVDMLQNRAMSAREPWERQPLQSYAKDASHALRQAGIPGIRYLDGGSRGAGTGTSNYVVFPGEENALRILERNGKPVP